MHRGNLMLQDWFAWALQQLDGNFQDVLLALLIDRPVQRLATICAGTESPLLTLRAFNESTYRHFAGQGLQQACRVDHLFSCEIVLAKREFLQKMVIGCGCDASSKRMCSCGFKTRLFADATTLNEGRAFDYSSQEMVDVDDTADEVWAGFPCTDVSSLRNQQARRGSKTVVQQGSQRTGGVFGAICLYLERLRHAKRKAKRQRVRTSVISGLFHALMLENVLGLTERMGADFSNLDYCEFKLASLELELSLFVFKLNPVMFGFPSQRWRLWMFAIMRELLQQACCSYDMVVDLATHLMNLLTTDQVFDLDALLLSNKHPLIENMSTAFRKGRKGKKLGWKWPSQNAITLERRGLDHWEPSVPPPEVMAEHPGLGLLNDRQFDIIRACRIKVPHDGRVMCDVSMSGEFAKKSVDGIAHIVTPSCELYFGHLCRPHHGLEAMHLQGIHFGAQHAKLASQPEPFPTPFLTNLAGNAFHVWCAAPVLMVREVVLAYLYARVLRAEQVVAGVPPAISSRSWSAADDLVFGSSDEVAEDDILEWL